MTEHSWHLGVCSFVMVALVGQLVQVDAVPVEPEQLFSPDVCLPRSSHLQVALTFDIWDQYAIMLREQS